VYRAIAVALKMPLNILKISTATLPFKMQTFVIHYIYQSVEYFWSDRCNSWFSGSVFEQQHSVAAANLISFNVNYQAPLRGIISQQW